ncbi:SAM-dependent methyltransferase [Actinoplanes sp. ATCC 53533]|uniref:class I SAM-dependent methyltransferase n=1 Tax=Actinoplanes sp. ATCC 53533 TaxID=1288362 RepID=UPI000F7B4B98|nr:class I SAM-dependent methyltransferase [Actinoplanes sp. ATCC 53533]RSM58058.1 SAM-dependent methyltransferase [Actinoplanes sp. ATCC 53533]
MTGGPVDFDAELIRYGAVLRRSWAVQPHDRILDVGCGAGQTTRAAAGMAAAGSVLGVDVSATAIERARMIARAEGPHNVSFEHADAQEHGFAPGSFDLAISRFGTMFFDDPVAAFGNIGRALRPAGRLVMVVWQAHDRNEWDVAIRQALAGSDGPAAVAGARPDPFSLADPTTVEGILLAAGFAEISFTDVHEPVYYGPDATAALAWVRRFASTDALLKRLDPAGAARALARLHDTIAARVTDEGVWFESRAWIVAARRR